ncbi:MAG: hypothetical protein ABI203_12205, partial [Mucilaginibacter sp.]
MRKISTAILLIMLVGDLLAQKKPKQTQNQKDIQQAAEVLKGIGGLLKKKNAKSADSAGKS